MHTPAFPLPSSARAPLISPQELAALLFEPALPDLPLGDGFAPLSRSDVEIVHLKRPVDGLLSLV